MAWNPPLVQYLGRRLVVDFRQIQPDAWKITGFLFVAFAAVAVLFLAIVIHELGHVLVGLWAGFGFSSLRVGRLQFDRPFRISLYRGKGTGAGGWARMFPVKQDKLAWRAAAMIFAGPAANLVSAAIVILLPFPPGPVSNLFTLFSLILGAINLLPFRSRAVHSDGSRILMLLRNRARGERWVAMLKLAAELRDGVMPEAWSSSYLAKATALRDKSPDTVTAYSFAHSTAFHQHKDAEAAQALEVCLQYAAYAAPVMRQALMSDAVVFQARRRKRVDLARQWLAAMPETTENKWLRPRAEAAIFEAQGDITGAVNKLDETEKQILAAPNPLQREIGLRYLRRWKAELEDPAAAHAASSGTALGTPLL
jgi:Peptidase family M50